jgi:hypothetical protein
MEKLTKKVNYDLIWVECDKTHYIVQRPPLETDEEMERHFNNMKSLARGSTLTLAGYTAVRWPELNNDLHKKIDEFNESWRNSLEQKKNKL